eukprot:s2855_g4.t1
MCANAGLGPAVQQVHHHSPSAQLPHRPMTMPMPASSKSQPDRHVIAADGKSLVAPRIVHPLRQNRLIQRSTQKPQECVTWSLTVCQAKKTNLQMDTQPVHARQNQKHSAAATAMDVSSEKDAVNDPEVILNTGKDGHTTKNMADTETENQQQKSERRTRTGVIHPIQIQSQALLPQCRRFRSPAIIRTWIGRRL